MVPTSRGTTLPLSWIYSTMIIIIGFDVLIGQVTLLAPPFDLRLDLVSLIIKQIFGDNIDKAEIFALLSSDVRMFDDVLGPPVIDNWLQFRLIIESLVSLNGAALLRLSPVEIKRPFSNLRSERATSVVVEPLPEAL
jgi:hypothetical protein